MGTEDLRKKEENNEGKKDLIEMAKKHENEMKNKNKSIDQLIKTGLKVKQEKENKIKELEQLMSEIQKRNIVLENMEKKKDEKSIRNKMENQKKEMEKLENSYTKLSKNNVLEKERVESQRKEIITLREERNKYKDSKDELEWRVRSLEKTPEKEKDKEADITIELDTSLEEGRENEEIETTKEEGEKVKRNRNGDIICEIWISHWDAICHGKFDGSCKKAHPVICKNDRKGCRYKNNGCYYLHLDVERVKKYDEEKKVCWDYKMGQCKFGSRCRWAHELTQEEEKEGMKIWSEEVDEAEEESFSRFQRWWREKKE